MGTYSEDPSQVASAELHAQYHLLQLTDQANSIRRQSLEKAASSSLSSSMIKTVRSMCDEEWILTFDGLQADLLPEQADVINLRCSETITKAGFIGTLRSVTHGNSSSRASVIPSPARRIGAKPTTGFMALQVKGATGVL